MGSANSMNMDESGVQTFDSATGNLTGSTTTQYAILAGDANNKIQNVVGTGSSGEVLTSNGAGALPTWQAGSGGATSGNRVLIQSQTAASVASITFTTGITGYDLYELDIYGVSTTGNNATAQIFVQLSTDAGSTWVSTAYYEGGAKYLANATGAYFYTSNGANWILTNEQYDDATTTFTAYLKFANLGSSSIYKSMQCNSNSQSNWAAFTSIGGYVQTASVCNGIKIYPNAGTFDTGTFKLYGIKN